MKRLLLYFSYIGTNYKGLQINSRRIRNDLQQTVVPDFSSVQGILEHGLRKILHLENVSVITSSRTDAGVHALSSTVQFDIDEKRFDKVPYSPEKICQSLNLFLDKNETDIRAQKIVQVPDDFFCRRAYSRTYLYRIAVAKNNAFENSPSLLRLTPALPITLLNRCQAVSQPFDISAVQEACRVFVGEWDFRTFSKQLSGTELKKNLAKNKVLDDSIYLKTIYKFSFTKSELHKDLDYPYYYSLDPISPKFDLYDFTVEGSGFLRRQVRRMVGALLSVGGGVIVAKDILFMLENPSNENWSQKCVPTFADGLYLKSVNYKSLNVLRGSLE